MRRNPLDGPGMGYGPAAGGDRRGRSAVTVILAVLCLLLAATLAYVLLRPPGQTAAPAPAVTATTTAAAPTSAAAPTTAASKPAPAPPSATGPARPSSAAPTPGGSDATLKTGEPEGVRDAATTFLQGWLEPDKAKRVKLLQVSATDSLLDSLADVDPAKIPDVKPVGALVVPLATDYSAAADQKMSDGTTVRMELVYEPSSKYGWLVDAVGPLE
jgi:hypothetical protein